MLCSSPYWDSASVLFLFAPASSVLLSTGQSSTTHSSRPYLLEREFLSQQRCQFLGKQLWLVRCSPGQVSWARAGAGGDDAAGLPTHWPLQDQKEGQQLGSVLVTWDDISKSLPFHRPSYFATAEAPLQFFGLLHYFICFSKNYLSFYPFTALQLAKFQFFFLKKLLHRPLLGILILMRDFSTSTKSLFRWLRGYLILIMGMHINK